MEGRKKYLPPRPRRSQKTTQEARPVACQTDQLQYLKRQAGIQVEVPVIGKFPSPVPIIKPYGGISETPTKNPPHVPKEFQITNPIDMLMEYPSGYPKCALSTI